MLQYCRRERLSQENQGKLHREMMFEWSLERRIELQWLEMRREYSRQSNCMQLYAQTLSRAQIVFSWMQQGLSEKKRIGEGRVE